MTSANVPGTPDNLNPLGGHDDHNRLLDLLADRATVGLTRAEHAELDAMLNRADQPDHHALDVAAAALACGLVAGDVRSASVPTHLLARLNQQAIQTLSEQKPAARTRRDLASDTDSLARRSAASTRTAGAGWRIWGGWVAAAACLAFAVFAWTQSTRAGRTPSLSSLIAAQGTITRDWGFWPEKPPQEGGEPVPCAKSVTGKVYWNQELQAGYMVFKGLAANDPAASQYQLWIIDKSQKHPIDGGVFDAAAANQAGEIVVPIASKLGVKDLVGFGITEEPAGGVVVSDQKRRVVVALVGS